MDLRRRGGGECPGTPAADLVGLRDMLLRVSQMANDLPQIAALDPSTVRALPDRVRAIDARSASRPLGPPAPTCANCDDRR